MIYGRNTIVEIENELEAEQIDNLDYIEGNYCGEDYKIVEIVRPSPYQEHENVYGYERYKLRSKFLRLKTNEITVSDSDAFGVYPYNVISWERKYDIDVTIGINDTGTGAIDTDKGTRLAAQINLFNPPKGVEKNLTVPEDIKLVGETYEKEFTAPYKTIMVRSGYYGVHGQNMPVLFYGKLEEVSYEFAGNDVEIELYAESAPEKSGLLPAKNYRGTFLDVIKELCVDGNVAMGYFPSTIQDEETGILMDVSRTNVQKDVDGSTTIKEAVDYIVEDVSKRRHIKLETDYAMGMVNIYPKNYLRYSGVQLTRNTGLISATKNEQMELDTSGNIELSETEQYDWTLDCLFLPDISYRDAIKFRVERGGEWKYISVISFEHDIPHDGSATTRIEGDELEVEPNEDDLELYTMRKRNPYTQQGTQFSVPIGG